MHIQHYQVKTADGWTLPLTRAQTDASENRPPVLFVPGYGMNSFIFRYHPRGVSMMEALVDAGFDPWALDPRGLSTTRSQPNGGRVSLVEQALVDLPAAFDHIAAVTGRERVHAIGCSLGGVLLYAYGGRPDHRIDRLVAIGTPLRWTEPSALLRLFAAAAPVMGRVRVRGTRRLARVALPLAASLAPGALSIYLNPRITATRPAGQLTRTVENPHRQINREIGRWIQNADLDLDGFDVTKRLATFDRRLLVLCGEGDQICPSGAALSAVGATGGHVESLMIRGDVAHADLFISDLVHDRVYPPVAEWFRE